MRDPGEIEWHEDMWGTAYEVAFPHCIEASNLYDPVIQHFIILVTDFCTDSLAQTDGLIT